MTTKQKKLIYKQCVLSILCDEPAEHYYSVTVLNGEYFVKFMNYSEAGWTFRYGIDTTLYKNPVEAMYSFVINNDRITLDWPE